MVKDENGLLSYCSIDSCSSSRVLREESETGCLPREPWAPCRLGLGLIYTPFYRSHTAASASTLLTSPAPSLRPRPQTPACPWSPSQTSSQETGGAGPPTGWSVSTSLLRGAGLPTQFWQGRQLKLVWIMYHGHFFNQNPMWVLSRLNLTVTNRTNILTSLNQ